MRASDPIQSEKLAAFCRKWRVRELSLFGSIVTDAFRDDSDVDVLVVFEPGHAPDLDGWLDMHDELREIFGRAVDLVERRQLTNPFRRHHILTTRQVVYAA